jgi:TolA-binding protein
LRESNDWKTLYERKEQEAKEAAEKLNSFESTLTNTAKFSAVREAALRAGIRQEAISDLELVDFKDVIVERSPTGRIEVRGHESAVERLKTLKPHWFGKSVNINSSIPTSSGQGIATEDELYKMSIKALESGDYTAYNEKLKQFLNK